MHTAGPPRPPVLGAAALAAGLLLGACHGTTLTAAPAAPTPAAGASSSTPAASASASATPSRSAAGPAPAPSRTSATPTASPRPTAAAATNPAGLDTGIASTTAAGSPWVVVDKKHPLTPLAYAPGDLQSVGHGQTLRSYAAGNLNRLTADAGAAGVTVYAASGYRSYAQQQSVHAAAVKDQGQANADEVSARAGYSEHQTGWAVDLATPGCVVDDCFAGTPAGRWVAVNAWRYGFVVRYPAGEQATTGYTYEPWHLRYVGPKLATAMHDRGVTVLERALGYAAAPGY